MDSFRNKPRVKRSVVWSVGRDELAAIVAASTTITAVLEHFGLSNKGGNFNTLKRRLAHDAIDFSHIRLGLGSNLGRNFERPARPIAELLVENSTTHRGYLKARLIKEGVLRNVCRECGQEPVWNGKPLILVLDHINGIPNDNRLENLRLLCPNCNSQTETFAGRKRKKPAPPITERKKRDAATYYRKVKVSKETVKEMKKTMTNTAIAAQLGVSEAAIRKLLRGASGQLGGAPQPDL